MEPKFQTSFIPKKPLSSGPGVNIGLARRSSPKRHSSLFMTFSVIIFLASVLGIGGAYLWKQYSMGVQVQYKKDLAEREKQFNIDLIEELKHENVKIDTARRLLKSHISMSQIFAFISRLTIENVRFMTFRVSAPADLGGGLDITLDGYGASLPAVAFQSDVLGQLERYGLRKAVKNPILSNPTINTSGTVSFSLSATVEPEGLLYEKTVSPSADNPPQQ